MKLKEIACSLLLVPTFAGASAFRLEARTEAQLYSIRTFRDGDPASLTTLPRRRLVQYLGLEAFELIAHQPVGFETSLRVFGDWGLPHAEAAKIDGAKSEGAELLYANVKYNGPHLKARVGRQTYVDFMDFVSFDGATIRYLNSFGLGAEMYGGLWVKGSSVLGSSVYQPDGIRESDLRRFGTMAAKQYAALDDIEPVVGGKILVEKLAGISASVGFRQAWLSGKTDIQRISGEAKWGSIKGVNVFGGLEYDLVMSRFSNLRLQGRYDGAKFGALAEVMHVTPVLSADSIFLYFASAPRNAVRVRGDYFPTGPFRFYLQGTFDAYGTNINSNAAVFDSLRDPALASATSYGGSAGAAWKHSSFRAAADLTLKTGWGGQQIWVDLNGGWAAQNGFFALESRVSFANIQDSLNARLKGNFVGIQASGSFFLTQNARASLVVEENINAFSKSDTKIFMMLDWKVVL